MGKTQEFLLKKLKRMQNRRSEPNVTYVFCLANTRYKNFLN